MLCRLDATSGANYLRQIRKGAQHGGGKPQTIVSRASETEDSSTKLLGQYQLPKNQQNALGSQPRMGEQTKLQAHRDQRPGPRWKAAVASMTLASFSMDEAGTLT